MLISSAQAQAAPADSTATYSEPSPFASILPLLLIFVVFYFLLIRPQQKKIREHDLMVKSLRRGDKVITGGGIIGSVVKIEESGEVHVEIAPEVKVKVLRESITTVLTKPSAADSDDSKGKGKKNVSTANDNGTSNVANG